MTTAILIKVDPRWNGRGRGQRSVAILFCNNSLPCARGIPLPGILESGSDSKESTNEGKRLLAALHGRWTLKA